MPTLDLQIWGVLINLLYLRGYANNGTEGYVDIYCELILRGALVSCFCHLMSDLGDLLVCSSAKQYLNLTFPKSKEKQPQYTKLVHNVCKITANYSSIYTIMYMLYMLQNK